MEDEQIRTETVTDTVSETLKNEANPVHCPQCTSVNITWPAGACLENKCLDCGLEFALTIFGGVRGEGE